MSRSLTLDHRCDARLLTLALQVEKWELVWSDRLLGRATGPPSGLTPRQQTRFEAAWTTHDIAQRYGTRIGNPGLLRRETREMEVLLSRGSVGIPVMWDMRLLYELALVPADLYERAVVISETESVG